MEKNTLWKKLEAIFSILSLYGLTTNNCTTKFQMFRAIFKYTWLVLLFICSGILVLNNSICLLIYFTIRLKEKKSGYQKTQQPINPLLINMTGAIVFMYVTICKQKWNRLIHSLYQHHVGPITSKATGKTINYIWICIVGIGGCFYGSLFSALQPNDHFYNNVVIGITLLLFGQLVIFGIWLCSIYYVVASYIPLRMTELLQEINFHYSPLRMHKKLKIIFEEYEKLNQLSTEFYQFFSPIIYFIRLISIISLAYNIKQLQIKWELLLCLGSGFRHLQLAFYLGFTISYLNLTSSENVTVSQIAKSITQEMLNVRSSLTSSIYESRLAWILFKDLITFSHIRAKRTADTDTDIITLFTDVCDMINLVDSNY
ncbi:hypothetical protein CHUAL_003619 [Chamberlinius hualienensis]